MIARIRAKTEEEQTIKEHSEHVAQLAAHSLAGVGLSALGQLAGLLHDMGKYTRAFYDYIWQAYRHPEAKPPKGTLSEIFNYPRRILKSADMKGFQRYFLG